MSVIKPVVFGVLLAIWAVWSISVTFSHPMVGLPMLVVGLLIAGYLKFRRVTYVPVGRKGKIITWNNALFSSAAIGVLVYILLAFLFGAAFKSLAIVGPWAILANPAVAMGVEATTVALTLVASWCIFWLWLTKAGENRWLYWTAVVVSIVALVGMSLRGYSISRHPDDQDRRVAMSRSAFENVLRWSEAWYANFSWSTGQKANELFARYVGKRKLLAMPDVLPKGLAVYAATIDESHVQLTVPMTPEPGLEWFALMEIQAPGTDADHKMIIPPVGDMSGMSYTMLVSRADSTVFVFIRQDWLDQILELMEEQQARTIKLANTPEPEASVVPAVLRVPMKPVGEVRMTDDDVVIITEKEWTDTEIVPEDNDEVEVRGGYGELLPVEELRHVLIRAGAAKPGELRMNADDEGLAFGLTVMKGKNPPRVMPDGTTRKAVLRLKLSEPGTLTVRVIRIKEGR